MKSELAAQISSRYRKMWWWSLAAVLVFALAFAGAIILVVKAQLATLEASGEPARGALWNVLPEAIATLAAFLVSLALLIITFVYAYMFLYSCWKVVAKKSDRVGPLGRVLLLLVPYFGVIWSFFFFWEFAKRANKKENELGLPRKISSFVSFVYCILGVVSAILGAILQRTIPDFEAMSQNGNVSSDWVAPLMTQGFLISGISMLALILLVVFVMQAKAAAVAISEVEAERIDASSARDAVCNSLPTPPTA